MHLRIGVPVQPSLDFREPVPASRLAPRDDGKGPNVTSIIIASVVIGVIVIVLAYVLVRTVRSHHPTPKYIPTPFLKRVWRDWRVPDNRTKYALSEGDDATEASSTRRRSRQSEAHTDFEANLAAEQRRNNRQSTSTVDRNTSVRSVMTLPAYRQKPSEEEHVLGREGERDGIDVVVELPTAEEEEAMREQEMDALYQIRLARRRHMAEREERRQARREARGRNDTVALQEIRDQARAASTGNHEEIDVLRDDHERLKKTRQRAVSSVSYADLGVARLDGTRIRANSTESERVGLLSDAASISLSTRSPSSQFHRRDRSASSVLSIDTMHSDVPGSPGRVRSRTNSGANTPRVSQTNTRAGSSPELIDGAEADLGDAEMPPHSPPGYDEVSLDEVTPIHSRSPSPYPDAPPDYPGPMQARNQRLSAHIEDMVAQSNTNDDGNSRRSSRGVGGVPQLPSLRLARLPQIVIEPSTAIPRDDDDTRR